MTNDVQRLAWAQRVAAAAIGLYWVAFVLRHNQLPTRVVEVEWCFIVPDLAWIAVLFLVASRWLLAGDLRASTATAAAGGSIVYLGLLDIVLNLKQGQYTGSTATALLNASVNLGCLLFGFVNLEFVMRRSKGHEGTH